MPFFVLSLFPVDPDYQINFGGHSLGNFILIVRHICAYVLLHCILNIFLVNHLYICYSGGYEKFVNKLDTNGFKGYGMDCIGNLICSESTII